MRKNFYLFLLLISIAAASCSKTESGPSGVDGVAGKDGTTILNGTVDPTSSVGNAGDFYINLTSATMFGPKTSSGWGKGFTLKGANGVDGKDGRADSIILSGDGAPTNTYGNIYDFFIDL